MEPNVRMRETVDLKSYVQLLWRRKWFVLAPMVLAGIVGYVITLPRFMPKVYQCSATLRVDAPKPLSKELQGLVAAPSLEDRVDRLQNQIQSNEFLLRIIENTGMRDDAATQRWAERNQDRYPDLSHQDLVEHKLMTYLRRSIQMSARRGRSNQIQVAVMDFFPDRAYQLTRNLTAAIVEANRSTQLEDIQSTENFSNQQLMDYKSKLEEAEQKLADFQRRMAGRQVTPTLVNPGNASAVEEMRRTAEEDLERHRSEAAAQRQRLISGGISISNLDAVLRSTEIASLMNEGRELEAAYVRKRVLEAGAPGTGQSMAIQLARIVDQIRSDARDALADGAGLNGGLLDAADRYLAARAREQFASARLAAYDARLREYRQRATSAPGDQQRLQDLQAQVDLYRQLHDVFAKQITQTQISSAFEASNIGDRITIVDPPQRPFSPVKPRRGPIIGIAVMAGLTLGVFGAFVLEHHDQSFRDVKETESRLGIRVVGTIPGMSDIAKTTRSLRDAKGTSAEVVAQAFGEFLDDSPGYQEFRRTALALLRVGQNGPKSILITSARSGEGKSTAGTCLALTLAKELPRERIILVDMDIRKPSLARTLGLRVEGQGTAQILQQRRFDDMAARNILLPNLFVLPMERTVDSVDVISKESVRWLLSELRQRFDRIIIDSPPNLPVTDPLIIGPEVEAVLMVVKAGATPRETVQRSLEIQRQFSDNVWGVLMNNVSDALPYYYNYKHYGYGYKKSARG